MLDLLSGSYWLSIKHSLSVMHLSIAASGGADAFASSVDQRGARNPDFAHYPVTSAKPVCSDSSPWKDKDRFLAAEKTRASASFSSQNMGEDEAGHGKVD